jgi:nucleoside-diphosphate-sugar epimerase
MQTNLLFFSFFVVSYFLNCNALSRVTVFGATGGVGQLICQKLIGDGFSVLAVTRDILKAKEFPMLNQCLFLEADAKFQDSKVEEALKECDHIVISVGTTAFPSSKWKNGNTPFPANVDTVTNIIEITQRQKSKPKSITLISSIGVERTKSLPFNILNTYGILDAKKQAEDIVLAGSKRLGCSAIIIRPGRLIGEPFTNFDLAKLLNIKQGKNNRGIEVNRNDVLAGDTDRSDVAEIVRRLIQKKNKQSIILSIVNKPGNTPTAYEWELLLSEGHL